MADRFPTLRQRAQEYTGANDPTAESYNEEYISGPYRKYISNPYQEMKREKVQNVYNMVLEATGDPERALMEANAASRKFSRGEAIAETAAMLAIPGGAAKAVERGVELARGMSRGRNAMTAEEMLPRAALPAPRPGPSSPIGGGASGEPILGTSAERAPRLTQARTAPDELAVFEGEGGATADAVATARRMAQERAAAERGFRETQLATMEGEGGGAEALRAAQQRAREAEAAFLERQMMEAEGEGMGAFASRNRPPPRRYSADQDAAAGYGYTTQFPGTAVQPRYVGSQAATTPGRDMVVSGGRDVVPARTREGDLNALMDRYFGAGEGAAGGLPARGPTYYSDLPNAGPRLVGESRVTGPGGMTIEEWMAANNRPGMSGVGGEMPAWLKYALPTGAAVAGGTYLATGNGPQQGGPASTPAPVLFDDLTQVPEMDREVQGPPMNTPANIMRGLGMNAFRQAAPAATTTQPAFDPVKQQPQPPQREQRGFLDRLLGGPEVQSMGGNLMQDGKINWGSGESAADFVRASQAMRKMQEEGKEVRGINPELEGRASGGRAEDKSVHKALEIIHHLVKR